MSTVVSERIGLVFWRTKQTACSPAWNQPLLHESERIPTQVTPEYFMVLHFKHIWHVCVAAARRARKAAVNFTAATPNKRTVVVSVVAGERRSTIGPDVTQFCLFRRMELTQLTSVLLPRTEVTDCWTWSRLVEYALCLVGLIYL